MSCSRTQRSDAGEAWTFGLESSTIPPSLCAPVLTSLLLTTISPIIVLTLVLVDNKYQINKMCRRFYYWSRATDTLSCENSNNVPLYYIFNIICPPSSRFLAPHFINLRWFQIAHDWCENSTSTRHILPYRVTITKAGMVKSKRTGSIKICDNGRS